MTTIFSRTLLETLKKWIDRPEILAVKGPRQAGKTTLLYLLRDFLITEKNIRGDHILFFTFDDLDVRDAFSKDPKGFVRSYLLEQGRYYLFFDEYQQVPDGGRKLKLLYDSLRNAKFIISGSSSLELTESTAKYLVGRLFSFTLYPFSFGEFVEARDKRLARIYDQRHRRLNDFLIQGKPMTIADDIFLKELSALFAEYAVYGGYPEVIKAQESETKQMILKNIYDTYITKDIVELLRISDVQTFRHLVTLLAAQHGSMVNLEGLASECKSYYKEIRRFLSVLEETYVIRLLRPFHRNLSTELRKNPKSYVVDAGLRNYTIRNFAPLEVREDRGKLAEGFVFSRLLTMLANGGDIHYWRTLAKAEVDFIIPYGSRIIPVEVKYTSMKRPEIGRSFQSFLSAYHPERAVVVTKDFWGTMAFRGTAVQFIPICYL